MFLIAPQKEEWAETFCMDPDAQESPDSCPAARGEESAPIVSNSEENAGDLD